MAHGSPKTFEEALAIFESLEQELYLSGWAINGVYVWKLLRFQVFHDYRMMHGLAQEAHPEAKRLRKTKFQLIKEFPGRFIARNPFMASRRRTERVVIPHSRKRQCAGQLVDPISLRAWSGSRTNTSLVLDRTSPLDPVPLPGSPDYEVMARLGWIAHQAVRVTLSSEDATRINAIQKQLGGNLTKSGLSLEERVIRTVGRFIGLRFVYRALFQKIQPRALYVVVGYFLEAPIAAAQELGIPTAEFQHGSTDRGHLGYDYVGWKEVPYFADHLLTWGEAWYRYTELPQNCKVHPVGAPHIEAPMRQAQQENVRCERQLLVLSQGPVGESLMEATIQFARLCPHWDIVVRPHPGESALSLRAYLRGLDKNTADRIRVDNTSTMAEASSQAGVVFGVNSTALLESLLGGCKVALLRLPNTAAYFQPLLEDGNAFAVASGEELADCVEDLKKGSARSYFAEVVEDVCTLVEI